ncbi:hypothetical protein [Candidatus Ichthyocystis hellenicum]|uniref:hypothetical protein n=1 Tax=Candidatus Ichthyocystis hellenicum TaxID=1561003 RepID=UPI000B8234FE|nr:hypothetical protein [Candidatus Ichthyocystis hellenicum]
MVASKTNCSDYRDLEFQSEVAVENSSEFEDVVFADQNVRRSKSCSESLLLSLAKGSVAPLVFLSSLNYAAGDTVSLGWDKLRLSLCSLMYVERCFNDAVSKGEDVPVVNVTDILSFIVNDAFEYASKHNISTPENMGEKESIAMFSHVDDRIAAACRSLVFNLTSPILRHLNQSQRDDVGFSYFYDKFFLDRSSPEAEKFSDHVALRLWHSSGKKFNDITSGAYYLLYLLDQVGKPKAGILNCTYTDYAIRSNVSADALRRIIIDRRMETLDSYCPDIRKYVPVDKHAADPRELILTRIPELTTQPIAPIIPESTIQPPVETASSNELTVVSVVLVVVGVLLFAFYAVSNLVRRNHYFSRQRNNARDASVEPLSQRHSTSEELSSNQESAASEEQSSSQTHIASGESSDNIPYRRLNKATAREK